MVRSAPPDTTTALIVRKGAIGTLKDLEGKRVAVNVINSSAWLHAVAALEKHLSALGEEIPEQTAASA